jgi:hypothetical protein
MGAAEVLRWTVATSKETVTAIKDPVVITLATLALGVAQCIMLAVATT